MFSDLLHDPMVARLGWTLLHFLWQGTLIFVLATAVSTLISASPVWRYRGMLLGLFAMAITVPVTFLSLENNRSTQAVPSFAVTDDQTVTITDATVPDVEIIAEEPTPLTPSGEGVAIVDGFDSAPRATIDGAVEFPPVVTPPPMSADPSPVHSITSPAIREELEPATVADAPVTHWTDSIQPWLPTVVGVWTLGVLIFAFRLMIGWIWLNRTYRGAGTPLPEKWLIRAEELAERLRVSKPVLYLSSTIARVPATFGFFRPVISVPAALLSSLSVEEIDSLLAHELAHIQRNDWLINVVQCVIETLLFYHPAVWMLSRMIRQQRERLSDDLAVSVIGDRITYSKALAALAESAYVPRLATPAGGGELSSRIRRVLGVETPSVNRAQWAAPIVSLLVLAAATVALTSPESTANPDLPKNSTDDTTASSESEDKTGPSPVEPQADTLPPIVITGTVVREDGTPVADAPVWLTCPTRRWKGGSTFEREPIRKPIETKTDGAGQFEFSITDPKDREQFFTDLVPFDVVSVADGTSVGWSHVSSVFPLKPRRIVLREPRPIEGIVANDLGEPLADAVILIDSFIARRHLTERSYDDSVPSADRNYLRLSASPIGALIVRSNAEGEFQLPFAPPGVSVVLSVRKPKHEASLIYCDSGLQDVVNLKSPSRNRAEVLQPNPVLAELHRARSLMVKVVYDDTGKPAVGAKLPSRRNGSGFGEMPVADAEGIVADDAVPMQIGGTTVFAPERTPYLSQGLWLTGKAGAEEVRTVRLPSASTILGRVVDSETGEGIADVPVMGRTKWNHPGWVVPRELARTADDGSFEAFVRPGEWQLLTGNPPVGYEFVDYKQAPHDWKHGVNITVEPQSLAENVELKLKKVPAIGGTVRDPTGAPATGVRVITAFKTSPHPEFDIDRSRSFATTTDAHGAYTLPGLFGTREPVEHESCRVLFFDPDRQLAAMAVINPPGPGEQYIFPNIALQKTGTVTGRIINTATGKPASGVIVRLYATHLGEGLGAKEGRSRLVDSDHPISYRARTDADGRYVLHGAVPGQRHKIRIEVAPGYGSGQGPLSFVAVGEQTTLGDIQLTPGDPKRRYGFDGVPNMTDTSKSAVAVGKQIPCYVHTSETRIVGAAVRVSLNASSERLSNGNRVSLPYQQLLQTVYTTGINGDYRIEIPPALAGIDGLTASVRVEHPEYAGRSTQFVPIEELTGEVSIDERASWHLQNRRHAILKTHLNRGKPYAGRVVLPDGTPAIGAYVETATKYRPYSWKFFTPTEYHSMDSSVTDEQGRFYVVTDQRATLKIHHDGYAPLVVDDLYGSDAPALPIAPGLLESPTDGERANTFRLSEGIRIRGRVIDWEGRGISRAIVRAGRKIIYDEFNMPVAFNRSAVTDTNGQYEIPPLPEGSYDVVIAGRLPDEADIGAFQRNANSGSSRVVLVNWSATSSEALRNVLVSQSIEITRSVPAPTLDFREEPTFLIRSRIEYPDGPVDNSATSPVSVRAKVSGKFWSRGSTAPNSDGISEVAVPVRAEDVILRTGLARFRVSDDAPEQIGKAIHIGKVTKDIDGITITKPKLARLKVRLTLPDGVDVEHLNLTAWHVREGFIERKPEPTRLYLSNSIQNGNTSYEGSALPGEEILFSVFPQQAGSPPPFYQRYFTLSSGEERTVEIDIPEEAFGNAE